MSNVLKGIGARIDKIPADFIDKAVDIFVVVAEKTGGTMMGRYQLTAKETNRSVGETGATVIMQGVPSGFWSWREYGISSHRIAPRRRWGPGWVPGPLGGDLARAAGHTIWKPVIHPGVQGKLAWTHTVDLADRAIGELAAREAGNLVVI